MKVAIVYHLIPHYRAGVMRALERSRRNEYAFFGSAAAFEGINPLAHGALNGFVPAPFVFLRGLYWQTAALRVALSRKFDAVIYLANPNFVSTWVGAALARLTGKQILFWTHGWLKPEAPFKAWTRKLFYGLAHGVLVYGERAKALGTEAGFPEARVFVIYNSLDGEAVDTVYGALEAGRPALDPRSLFARPELPLLVCTARLTPLCRFDLLLDAADRMRQRGRPVNVLLVGDGPERKALEDQAKAKRLDVRFYGACYDEPTLGAIIYGADLSVSPGKVGLTAMHSLMYGTPVITHADLDHQMPEVEAIVEGETGAFFARDDTEGLVGAIEGWLAAGRDRAAVRQACRRTIADKWNPATQVRLIEAALANTQA